MKLPPCVREVFSCFNSKLSDSLVSKLLVVVQLRNGGPVLSNSLPVQWVESQASVLLLTMLQHCSSQYDLHRLLQLLANVDNILKSTGEMFQTVVIYLQKMCLFLTQVSSRASASDRCLLLF